MCVPHPLWTEQRCQPGGKKLHVNTSLCPQHRASCCYSRPSNKMLNTQKLMSSLNASCPARGSNFNRWTIVLVFWSPLSAHAPQWSVPSSCDQACKEEEVASEQNRKIKLGRIWDPLLYSSLSSLTKVSIHLKKKNHRFLKYSINSTKVI